jgi:hypothetical protein
MAVIKFVSQVQCPLAEMRDRFSLVDPLCIRVQYTFFERTRLLLQIISTPLIWSSALGWHKSHAADFLHGSDFNSLLARFLHTLR